MGAVVAKQGKNMECLPETLEELKKKIVKGKKDGAGGEGEIPSGSRTGRGS